MFGLATDITLANAAFMTRTIVRIRLRIGPETIGFVYMATPSHMATTYAFCQIPDDVEPLRPPAFLLRPPSRPLRPSERPIPISTSAFSVVTAFPQLAASPSLVLVLTADLPMRFVS